MLSKTIHSPAEETGEEKHVPHIEKLDDKTIKVTYGKEIMHPSTEQHYIAWIKLFGIDKDGNFRELGSINPTPVLSQPAVYFTVDISNYKELQALIYCNIHDLWENSLTL